MADRVLVTGGSGFLAEWQIVKLLRAGYNVRATLRDLARADEVRTAVAREIAHADRVGFVNADLTCDGGWEEAVNGCSFVLHIASPFPIAQPDNPDDLIVPARDGVLRILRAAVKRVVMTSSSSALSDPAGRRPVPLTEAHWTDPDARGTTPYVKSKVLSERAAWDYMKAHGGDTEFAVIAPTAIIGPALSRDLSASVHGVRRLLIGDMPGIPRLGFPFVDVRDIADLQLLAMTRREAVGERIAGAGRFMWLADAAAVLRQHLGEAAAKVPTRTVPSILIRMMSLRDPGLRSVVRALDRERVVSSEKAHRLLGWMARPAEESLIDCARSLSALGLAP
ncbi:MAG: NAD-dependent epimerase/dehydratase family protein [Alphaproteobacteria bacterium]|nr:NAD-dependent epimerase/dehydratase family protein [Alphaproteobacteria bacterium]